jgi:TonB family protein
MSGMVVYLLPVNPVNDLWWMSLNVDDISMPDAYNDRPRLGYEYRAIADRVGQFQFPDVRPGHYYVYSRLVLTHRDLKAATSASTSRLETGPVAETTLVEVNAYVSTAYVRAGDSTRVIIARRDRLLLDGRSLPDPGVPGIGAYTYFRTAPRLISSVVARYPDSLPKTRTKDLVTLMVLVTNDGTVSDTRVIRSTMGDLDSRAGEAARHWRFDPARNQDGSPAAVWFPIRVRFEHKNQRTQ